MCSEAYTDCVSGRFIADAVENLDYKCAKIQARTDVDGAFSCPKNQPVTFYLLNPDDTVAESERKQIVLGQVTVRKPALASGRFYVTPATLLPNSVVGRLNMVRLLLALNKDPLAISLNSPAHRIKLDQADKEKLSKLAQQITATDFERPIDDGSVLFENTFDALVQPFLAELSPAVTLASRADAELVLKRSVYASSAGMYTANSLAGYIDLGSCTDCSELGAAGLSGTTAQTGTPGSSDISFAGDTWLLVDRKGRLLGQGIYATKQGNLTGALTYVAYPVKPMILEQGSLESSGISSIPFWPSSGLLKGLSFSLQDVGSDNKPRPFASGERRLTFFQGTMEKGAVAGTRTTYNNLFGDYPDADNVLGLWQLEDSTSGGKPICPDSDGLVTTGHASPCVRTPNHRANYTLVRSSPVAPTLDPQAWENVSNPLYPRIRFPLNIKMIFKNAGTTTATEKTWGPIYVSVLRDGNIVTNLNYDPDAVTPDCNVDIDPDTLKDQTGQQEYPIGTILNISRTSSDDSIPEEVFIAPLLTVPNIPAYAGLAGTDGMLPYIQFLSNIGQSFSIRLGKGSACTGSPCTVPYANPSLTSHSATIVEYDDNACKNPDGCVTFGDAGTGGWIQSWRSWYFTWYSAQAGVSQAEKDRVLANISGTVKTEPVAHCQ